jgi:CarD family transcriptional regulator
LLRLAVGDVVVYGPHGAGLVASRETRKVDGEQHTVIVLALPAGLSVELSLERAQEQLRPLADETEIARVSDVLGGEGVVSQEPWLTRRRNAKAKLKVAVGLAEIIRDGNARERAKSARFGSNLSPGERELVRQARGLLAHELALSRGVGDAEASAWIDRQLTEGR